MSSKWFLSKTWPRPFYVLFRVGEMLGSLISRAFNAFVLGGSTYQTTSSRCHIENWPRGEAFVNAIFFFQRNPRHCQWAWEREVAEAKKTLKRASVPRKKGHEAMNRVKAVTQNASRTEADDE